MSLFWGIWGIFANIKIALGYSSLSLSDAKMQNAVWLIHNWHQAVSLRFPMDAFNSVGFTTFAINDHLYLLLVYLPLITSLLPVIS
jgi:hypothetical protein